MRMCPRSGQIFLVKLTENLVDFTSFLVNFIRVQLVIRILFSVYVFGCICLLLKKLSYRIKNVGLLVEFSKIN